MSTISTVAGTTRLGLQRLSRISSLLSGTFVDPIFGSIVQNGKFALCALPELTQLKSVDFPTLGRPTMPHLSAMCLSFKFLSRKFTQYFYICESKILTDEEIGVISAVECDRI